MRELADIKNIKYPNPYYRIDDFILLNGPWDFTFSDSETIPSSFERKIIVPFPYEAKASSIGDKAEHNSVWYRRKLIVKSLDKHHVIKFLAVDYETILFVNGKKVGEHLGGYTPFQFDFSEYLSLGENVLVIHVKDTFKKDQLRGKQRTKEENYGCWYTQTTGIVQNVYLERTLNPDIKNIFVEAKGEGKVKVMIDAKEKKAGEARLLQDGKCFATRKFFDNEFIIEVENPLLWSKSRPCLYDLELKIGEETIGTSFGFRTIERKESKIFLNGREIYLRMILDQGYFADSLTTPPNVLSLYKDISLIKEMGFNGVRKHQKIEDPRFYYLCDYLGLYVWCELPSCYEYSERMKNEIRRDLPIIQDYLYNSPSIIVYLLFNESWGIPNIKEDKGTDDFVKEIFALASLRKGNRLIITNDGWNQTAETDVLSVHDYEQDSQKFEEKYGDKDKLLEEKMINGYGPAFNSFGHYSNQPIMFSEFGGASMSQDGWGYGEKANDSSFLPRFQEMMKAVRSLTYLSGFCYTQLTDVEQETNGLLTIDRKPKIPMEAIKEAVAWLKS